jgi:hypothetical protein
MAVITGRGTRKIEQANNKKTLPVSYVKEEEKGSKKTRLILRWNPKSPKDAT